MKLKKALALSAVGMMAFIGCGSHKVDSTPSTSQGEVTNQEEAAGVDEEVRIVSATVAATHVLDKLDAELVGIPKTANTLPERYLGIEEVGMATDPDLEKIVSLDPDIVVIDQHFKEKVDTAATELGLNVFYFDTTSVDNFVLTIEKLGEEVNKTEQAAAFINEIKEAEASAQDKVKEGDTPTVAVLFGSSSSFMLATETSYIGDLVSRVGAKNITTELAKDQTAGYIQFSLEQIIQQNPNYILRFAHGNIEETKKSFDAFFNENPAWDTLDAVKEGRVVDLDSSVFNTSANVFITEAISQLGEIFYGE